jgi:hypothetical protein
LKTVSASEILNSNIIRGREDFKISIKVAMHLSIYIVLYGKQLLESGKNICI